MDEYSDGNGGCLRVFGIVCPVVFMLAITFTVFAYLRVKDGVGEVTSAMCSETPQSLPHVESVGGQGYEKVWERWKNTWEKAMVSDEATELVVDEQTLNVLLQNNPETSAFTRHVYVDLKGDLVRAKSSVPLEKLPIGKYQEWFDGLYFNVALSFNFEIVDGEYTLQIQDAWYDGKKVSDKEMKAIRDARLQERLEKQTEGVLQALQVKHSKVYLTVKNSEK
jgi:hypothetical protein